MKVPEMEWMFHDVPSPEEEAIEKEDEVELDKMIREGLGSLTGMERRVIEAMYFTDEPPSQQALADELGVNQKRVSRLHFNALSRMKINLL